MAPGATPRFVLEDYLAERRARVKRALEHRLEILRARTFPRLWEAMQYALLGPGKRLRPVLCLAFAEATRAGGHALPLVEDAAVALEMVHAYSLVHDDLPAMDDDDERRGRPTAHRAFGEAMAILAGDALLTEAFRTLGSGEEVARLGLSAELAVAAGAEGMVGGQAMDVLGHPGTDDELLLEMNRLKTGRLIRAACRMGVLAAGGGASELQAAGEWGDAVGLVFQIADDLMDLDGPDAGTTTFVSALGAERARARAEAELLRAEVALRTFQDGTAPLSALARYALERKS